MSGGGHGGGGLPFLNEVSSLLHSSHNEGGIHVSAKPLIIAFILANIAFFLFFSWEQTLRNYSFLVFLAPLWMPYVFGRWAWYRYLEAKRAAFIAKQQHILLELRLPRDTMKTPAAMEAVFSSIHIGPGEATWWKRLVLGNVRPWYSLEIVAKGGKVHFYIWTRAQFRRAIESALYAQFPDMEIIEVEDYSRETDPSHAPNKVAAFEYVYSKPDPWPLKTYTAYGLQPGQKAEEQVDPLAQVIELMGSIGPKEQLWVQMVIRTTKAEKFAGMKTKKGEPMTWKDLVKEEMESYREKMLQTVEYFDAGSGKTVKSKMANPTRGQSDMLFALETKASKLVFDVGIRALYTAPEDAYQGIMGGFLVTLFKPFASDTMNSLTVTQDWSNKYNDYPWEDPHGHHFAHSMHFLVNVWRRRAFFHPPYVGRWNIMNVEELASLFHVPSSAIATPSLPRIQSSTGGAPGNLPT